MNAFLTLLKNCERGRERETLEVHLNRTMDHGHERGPQNINVLIVSSDCSSRGGCVQTNKGHIWMSKGSPIGSNSRLNFEGLVPKTPFLMIRLQ